MRLRWALALAATSLSSLGCTVFPDIPSGACGNSVVDPDEDCDTFKSKGTYECRPKGAVGECHIDCSVRNGVRRLCPDGMGCDSDAICRWPSGNFSMPSNPVEVGAWSLASGDFDGDGREDVMSSEPLDSIGLTRLRFLYFDAQGALDEVRQFPKNLLTPSIAQLSDDKLSDVSFSTGQIGVMLGRPDRNWVPETFSSYQLANTRARVIPVSDHQIELSFPIVPLVDVAGSATFSVGSTADGTLQPRASLGGGIDDLVGEPASGNLFEETKHSPCAEIVYALRGATELAVLNVCDTRPTGEVIWRDEFERTRVRLDPPGEIDGTPLIADLNGDHHLDVLVGAGGRAYVAYGDGAALSSAVPYQLAWRNETAEDLPMPLAAADFTNDGAPDFVFPGYLLTSTTPYVGALPVYSSAQRNLGPEWTTAVIADFNGNDTLDVVAGSNRGLNLQFFNGLGKNLIASTISTAAPVQALAFGDFDSDLITDLALIEVAPAGQAKSVLRIAYGSPFMQLGVPVAGAELAQPEAFIAFQQDGIDSLVVSSNETQNGVPTGTLTFLGGTVDRVPFAPLMLSEFSSNGSVQNSACFAVAGGHHLDDEHGDLIALAIETSKIEPSLTRPNQLWSLPAIASTQAFSGPVRLRPDLDETLVPNKYLDLDGNRESDFASVSADFSGDGRDEALFAAPSGVDRTRCALIMIGAQGHSTALVQGIPIVLDEPCADPQLAAADVNGDGHNDLLLLSGDFRGTERKLFVLWNDEGNGFAATDRSQLSSAGDSPQAFAVLPSSTRTPLGLVYITDTSLLRVRITPGTKEFSAPEAVLGGALSGGTGVVAADVNGDSVKDLVISQSGKLSVLMAELLQ